MSRPGQTNGMHAAEHVAELERYVGRAPEHVIWNTTPLPEAVVERYAAQGTHPIENNILPGKSIVHQHNLLAGEVETPVSADSVVRSLLRHDSANLARVLVGILESTSPRFQK